VTAAAFKAKCVPEPNTGCWLWLQPDIRGGRISYGHFRIDRRPMGAHRASWLLYRGEIPAGAHVLHRCDTPSCVNPDHLFLGTHDDNMRDMAQKGRSQRHNARKTHCPAGHAYDGSNVYEHDGRRHCRTCVAARVIARRARLQGTSVMALVRGKWRQVPT
jgi:hypothetical protein